MTAIKELTTRMNNENIREQDLQIEYIEPSKSGVADSRGCRVVDHCVEAFVFGKIIPSKMQPEFCIVK